MKKLIKYIIISVIIFLILFSLRNAITKKIFPLYYGEHIEKYSEMYELDKYLVMGVISTESRFDEQAQSNKDARGLMQITEETAQWCIDEFDIDSSLQTYMNPEENIQIGCAYLKYLLEHFDGNKRNALAAYNAGIGNVEKWLNDKNHSEDGKVIEKIPFEETRKYVEKVESREKIYRKLYNK